MTMLVNGVILASVTTAFQVVVLLLNALPFSSERLVVATVFEDFGLNSHDRFVKSAFGKFALPNDDNHPSLCFQFSPNLLVTLLVPVNLGRPVIGIGFRNRIVSASFVAMPEAAVNEDYSPVLGKDDIWRTWETFVIYPIAESQAPESVSQAQLRLGRSGVDGRHVAVALSGSKGIGHKHLAFAQKYTILTVSFVIFSLIL